MISITYSKLDDVCKALKDFQGMLSEYLDGSKRALNDIYFTPLEMLECPKIHVLEEDMYKLQGQGKHTYEDIQGLILISTMQYLNFKQQIKKYHMM